MKVAVLVLLSAYNGANYLRTQMESVLAQEGDFTLTLRVRDDGSRDDTPRLLAEYQEKYPDRVEIIRGENLGYNGSFFTLIDRAEGFDYYAFCDQDDEWLPGKIQGALRALEGKTGPALYSAPSIMTDAELRPIGKTRMKKRPLTVANTMIQNICPGHNQVLNEALMQLVRRPRDVEQIYVYDLWVANLAALYGEIVFDEEPRTLYRQHGDNELGSRSSRLGKLMQAGRRSLAGEGVKNKRQMQYFATQNREELEAQGLFAPAMELAAGGGLGKRAKLALTTPFYRQSRLESAAFRLALLLGKY